MLNSIKRLLKINCPLDKREKNLLKTLKTYEVTDGVKGYYKKGTKNNGADGDDLIKKKLIRNVLLAAEVPIPNEYIRRFNYGNLEININTKTKEFTYLQNRKGIYHFKVDKVKKEYLNWHLGIK